VSVRYGLVGCPVGAASVTRRSTKSLASRGKVISPILPARNCPPQSYPRTVVAVSRRLFSCQRALAARGVAFLRYQGSVRVSRSVSPSRSALPANTLNIIQPVAARHKHVQGIPLFLLFHTHSGMCAVWVYRSVLTATRSALSTGARTPERSALVLASGAAGSCRSVRTARS